MITMKILLVEDNKQDRKICQDAVKDFNTDNQKQEKQIELIEAINLDEALAKLDNSFDGAIIDLKLGKEGGEGNSVIKKIEESNFRIPVIILTGTPDSTDSDLTFIQVFKRGAKGAAYSDLLLILMQIYDTGLTRIMGGRGIIEEALGKVFKQNLLPAKDKWVTYGQSDPSRTERALLRHTLSHLLQLLDDDGDRSFPEEVYLTPPLTDKIWTGSVVKEKSDNQFFVVMTPACDLVTRNNGKCNMDRILIVEVDSQTSLFPGYPTTGLSNNQKGELEKAYKNKKSTYYHWLPKTNFFEGGFLNFRKLSSLSVKEFDNKFEKPAIQISPNFVKDIVARFSAYYARQGQPDIDFDQFISTPETQTEISQ